MAFLVDGDNLLGTWPGRPRSEAERRRLAFELDRFAARRRRRVVVVFDGPAPLGDAHGPDVTYSGAGHSADDSILAFLRRQADRRGWTVITSDRPLGDRCRSLGARVERSDRFRRRLCDVRPEEKPEREDEIDYWLDRFHGE